jgi:hypothetical protein
MSAVLEEFSLLLSGVRKSVKSVQHLRTPASVGERLVARLTWADPHLRPPSRTPSQTRSPLADEGTSCHLRAPP